MDSSHWYHPDMPETWIDMNEGSVTVIIVCIKKSCRQNLGRGFDAPGEFEIPGGYYLQPKDIDKAFMEHRVAHS